MICPHCQKDTDNTPTEELPPHHVLMSEIWFSDFWNCYPRHVGKAAALKAWKRAATSEKLKDEIMAGLKAQLTGMLAQERKFVPHAATWLNQKRFEDEISEPKFVERVIACEKCGDTGLVHVAERIVQGLRQDSHWERCSCSMGQLPGIALPASAAPF